MSGLRWVAVLGLLLALGACGGGSSNSSAPIDPSNLPLAIEVAAPGTGVSLVPSEFRQLVITGGQKPFAVVSRDPSVVLASVSDATLSLAGVKGSATAVEVVVTDALNKQFKLTVTVANPNGLGAFELVPAAVALAPGGSKVVSILGGTLPYTVISGNTSVVTTSVEYSALTLTAGTEGVGIPVRVQDSTGLVRVLPVTVVATAYAATGVAFFTNLSAPQDLSPGASRTFTLGGGTGPYVVTSDRPDVVSATVRGATLLLKGGVAGQATLRLEDATGAWFPRLVSVQLVPVPLAVSSQAVYDAVGNSVALQILGGRPPYAMYGTASGVVAGSVSGSVLNLTLLTAGNGFVTVYDAERNTVNVSVVATGTTTPTVLTLSPAAVSISENLAKDASGASVQTVVKLALFKATEPYQVFSSATSLLNVEKTTGGVLVKTPVDSTGKPLAPCVDADTKVTITVVDSSTGASVASVITVQNAGACTS